MIIELTSIGAVVFLAGHSLRKDDVLKVFAAWLLGIGGFILSVS